MTAPNSILLSTAYFAPIRYFSKLAAYPEIYIEKHENFVKQTYRNRTIILGANGPIPLIVPVEKGRDRKVRIADLRIAYDEEWQRNHWRTIFSAYNSSPFFEYYASDIEVFFKKQFRYLFDFNQQITQTILELLEIDSTLLNTDDFEQIPEDCLNFREQISPKLHLILPDPNYEAQAYTQVFSEKFGFIPDLSILDLLFNEGPSAAEILENSFIA